MMNEINVYVSEEKHFIVRIEDPTTSYCLTFTKES
jgi:hypothetical protein